MIDALSIDRFNDLVASYGADPDKWPAELRGCAVASLVASETARAAWRDAAVLDGDLDSLLGLETSPEAVETVLAIAEAPAVQDGGKTAGLVRQFLPYAAAAAIALVVGLSAPSPFRNATEVVLVNQAAITVPTTDADTVDSDDGLTTLALVDVSTFADNEADTAEVSDDEITLSSLPLR